MSLPEYRSVIPENIPAELKKLKIWAVWKPQPKEDKSKPGKVPMSWQVSKVTGEKEVRPASCDDSDTWMTFEDAVKLLKSSKRYKGLSIALSPEPPQEGEKRLIGIDLDKAVNSEGLIRPEFLEAIKSFNTYAELSPTVEEGGLRALCYGSFPVNEGVHQGNVEIYQCGKFLTITGHKLNDAPATIEEAQEAITAFRAQYFKPLSDIDETGLPVTNVKFTDDEIHLKIGNSKLGGQFKDLYYGGYSENDDKSTQDLKLCRLLVFWTQDPDQLDRIFRQSAIFRAEKWDKVHFSNGDTYGQGTIKKALITRKTVFQKNTGHSDNLSSQDFESFNFSMYPFSVKSGPESGIYKEVQNKYGDSNIIQVASTPCVITAIGENIDNGSILYKLKIRDIKGHEKYVWKSTSDLLKKSEILKLQDDGLHFKESRANDLIDYFDKFITQYNNKLVSEFAASVGGWKKDFSIFVLGSRAITKDSINEVLQLDNPTANFFSVKGDLDQWVKGAQYIANYPAVRYKMYNAMVPPILRLLYLVSYILDNHVDSGRLKSVSNWLAASMWGDPIQQQAGGNSSHVGILNLISYCVDIPTFLDETGQNPEAARKLSYSVGNVGSRLTGRNDGKKGLVVPPASATVLLATGEHPIIPENSNAGEDVRVNPLTEGVEKEFSPQEVIELERLIRENHGHIVVLFIQELLKHKDRIRDIFNANLEALPPVSGISENRVKKQYAAIATAGNILEMVFEKIGIAAEDPVKICSRYFEMNVMSKGFTADHVKALSVAWHWYNTNEVYFQENDINHTQYGWIREDKEIKDQLICFDEEQLKKQIAASLGPNRYESAVNKWRDLEIVKVRKIEEKDDDGNKTGKTKVLKTIQIKVNNRNTTVIAIPLKNFYKYLNITEEDKINTDAASHDPEDDSSYTKPENKYSIPAISADVSASSASGYDQVTSVTADSGNNNDTVIVTSSDLEAYELMKKEGLI